MSINTIVSDYNVNKTNQYIDSVVIANTPESPSTNNSSINNILDTNSTIKNTKELESNKKELEKGLNQILNKYNLEAVYSNDKTTGNMIWQLKDKVTGQVVQQIPSETQLNISKNISNFLNMYNKNGSASIAGVSKNGLILNENI